MLFLIPAKGFKVPDPAALDTPDDHLPAEGRLVEESGYWQRRIADGDVTVGTFSPQLEA